MGGAGGIVAILLTCLAGCSPAPPAVPTTPRDGPPRASAYCLRGFLGVWSKGLDPLAADLRRNGIDTTVLPHSDWRAVSENIVAARRAEAAGGPTRASPPLILIGHSWGA